MAKEFSLHYYIISVLRRASYRFRSRTIAFGRARIKRGLYKCADCDGEFDRYDVQLDHIEPVVDPIDGFISWDIFIKRLFIEPEGYACLCKNCHSIKTWLEKQLREEFKK